MKKILFPFFLIIVLLQVASCKKEPQDNSPLGLKKRVLIGHWREVGPNGSVGYDTVTLYSDGRFDAKYQDYDSYNLLTIDTIAFGGASFYSKHNSHIEFISDKEIRIDKYGINMIQTDYYSIHLIKF